MSVPKRHHYLPQFYLRGFREDQGLWVYDRERDDFRRRNPEKFGFEKGYYALLDEEGTQDYREVEKRLTVIESAAATVIKKIDDSIQLTLADKFALSLFAALLKVRTPAFERWLNEVGDAVAKKMMEAEIQSPEDVQQRLEMWGKDDPNDPGQAEQIYEGLRRAEYQVKASPNARIDQMLKMTREIGKAFTLMPWTLARSSTSASFVTSDNPLVVIHPDGIPDSPEGWPEGSNPYWFFGTGIAEPGAEVILPLNRRTYLIMGNEQHSGRGIHFEDDDVHRCNSIIAQHYERFLIAKDEALLRQVTGDARAP